ncbi:MAG: hypothetical protein JNK53_04280 [Phycisphaerae bacterium]|nr:hypothetical protein [Phycisphaerae bacterium]
MPDACQLAAGEPDLDGNGAPDACGDDCNGNGVSDYADLAAGLVDDCNDNGIPDSCEVYAPPPLPGVSTNGDSVRSFVWHRTNPKVPVVRALDVVFGYPTQLLLITVIRDQLGQAVHTQATEADVLLHIVRPMPPLPPPGPDGIRPPVRINIGPLDLSSTPAFWVRVSNTAGVNGASLGGAPVEGMTRWSDSTFTGVDPASAALLLRGASNVSTSFSGFLWLIAEPCTSPADLNLDGHVNGRDLGELLQKWGCIWCNDVDLDRNGVVAGGDLAVLLSEWNP